MKDFSADSVKSQEVIFDNDILPSVFNKNILWPTIEPAILDELEKQQNDNGNLLNYTSTLPLHTQSNPILVNHTLST